jgi:transglutaminase-like putative cysteine protease/Flp pilus assembly protein TadD
MVPSNRWERPPLSGTVLALLLTATLASPPVAAWDRAEREVADLVREVRRRPTGAAAELAVLEILARFDEAGPGPVLRALEQVAASPGLGRNVRERVRRCREEALLRTGNLRAASASRAESGFVSDWRVAGPFPDGSGEGARAPCPDPAAAAEWRAVPPEAVVLGEVRAAHLTARTEEACLCLAATVGADRPGPAALGLGATGAFTAWWNGAIVRASSEHHEALPDRHGARVPLLAGTNRLAVRLCADGRGELGLSARVVPLPGKAGPGPDAVDELLERARGPRARPADRHAAARYLLLTGAVDPASPEARDLARGACLGGPAADRCLTWAALARDRGERRRAVEAALRSDPASLAALVALTVLELEGAEPGRALDPLRRAARLGPADPEVLLLHARLEAARGLPLLAEARAGAAVEAAPESASILAAARDLAREAGLEGRALELTRRLAAVRADRLEDQIELAEAALASGDGAELERRLELLTTLGGGSLGALGAAARLLEGRGDLAAAENLLARRTEIAPDDAESLGNLAWLLLRRGERDRALAALGRALQLRPQDDRIADYLGFAAGGRDFAGPFTVAPEDFPAATGAGEDDNACLVDSTVVWLHPSGLASRFRQLVWRAGQAEVARELRRHAIRFAPESQRLRLLEARVLRPGGRQQRWTGRGTVDVAEPWYRLYYDLQAEIVELPALRRGDIVELRYRVDDTAHRNVYNDYFGDLVFAQDDLPKALWRYAVLSPPGTGLEFRLPDRLGPVTTRREERDGRRLDLFELRDVPRCRLEPGAPGPTPACDHLHVSTYRSWEDLGRWYQTLIRDQLTADARIREAVRGLTAGLGSPREKVAAIHRWVVTSTRYVGLEFGIHGYKPYAAPLVVARGFGDCKDKAGLLVTALREAGVEAEFALVRTRPSGDLDAHPPSLSVFDHAIVHVPGLGLWLDGTAEHSGTAELPFVDQDAPALRMTRDGPLPDRTPVLPPEANRVEARVRAAVDPGGSARFEAEVEIAGDRAAAYRARFAAEETRRQRFEALLAESLPGASLVSVSFDPLDDLERPVRYRYEAARPDFARRDRDALLLPVDPGLDLVATYGRPPERTQPLEIGPRRVDRRTTVLTLPRGWSAGVAPSDVSLETGFGKLNINYKYNSSNILINRSFILTQHTVPAAGAAAFLAFCREVDEALAAEVSLRREP